MMREPPPPDTTRLLLIRHGATPSNEQRPYVLQGNGINHSLSELGRRQAAAVSHFLRAYSIDRVICSPLLRARETAEVIAEPHGLAVETFDTLVEVCVGRWEGMAWETIMAEFPDDYAKFMSDPSLYCYLGGESYADVYRRAKPVFDDVLASSVGKTVVMVAHNVVNRVLLAELLGLELSRAKEIRQTNTGINIIRHRRGETELLTLNGVFHLNDEW